MIPRGGSDAAERAVAGGDAGPSAGERVAQALEEFARGQAQREERVAHAIERMREAKEDE